MRTSELFLAFAAALMFCVGPANAETITFDDLTGDLSLIPNGYAGLNWNNFGVITGTSAGYANGVVSPPNVAFNEGGSPASFSSSSPFELNSLYLSAAWLNGLQVQIDGYSGGLGGSLLDTTTVTINPTGGPTFVNLNWSGIDTVYFASFGGTAGPFCPGCVPTSQYEHFAMDNVTLTDTPLPAALPLFATGLGGLGLLGWRRKRKQAA